MENTDRILIDRIKNNIIKKNFIIAPVVALRSGRILDGAHRVKACLELSIPVPVIFIDAVVEEVDAKTLTTWLDQYEIYLGEKK